MKKISMLLLIAIFIVHCSFAQESVNWATPELFSAKEVKFKSGDITMDCKDCKCMEIRTHKGLTGIFIVGAGTYKIPGKSINDKFSNCLVRFNPAEYKRYITMTGPSKLADEGFYTASMQILKNVFTHCYHAGMDALFPEKGAYALNLSSAKFGDFLASISPEKSVYFSFSDGKEF